MLLTILSNESMVDNHSSQNKDIETAVVSSPSLVKSHPIRCPSVSASTTEKPFFIMDWLDEIDPKSVELAQQILTASQKRGALPKQAEVVSPSPVRQDLCTSHFMQRSISISNGYNAKGIQRARQGSWEDALACWNNALEIRTQVLGESHVDVANTCNNIGIALGKLNRSKEAITSLHRALDIRIKNYGSEHAVVAATLHNIGNVYQADGNLEASIQYFCHCRLLQEKIFGGRDHVEVARTCIAIGHTYFRADDFLDAREAYMDALAIFYRVGLEECDPEVLMTMEDIRDIDQQILFNLRSNKQAN